jgi:hypothetical protein
MSKPNVKRLTILVDYLKTLPDGVYNQASWGSFSESKCGLAHSFDIPEFNKLGYEDGKYKNTYYSEAAAKFFGLSSGIAEWLSIQGYTEKQLEASKPTHFIKRVEAIIDGRVLFDEKKETYKIIPKSKVAA